MNKKTTGELLAIWKANDRSQWSDETFEVIRDILAGRLKDVPLQNDSEGIRRRIPSRKLHIPDPIVLMLFPLAGLCGVVLLILILRPGPEERWVPAIFLSYLALLCLLGGIYLGWLSWFRPNKLKQMIALMISDMKKNFGEVIFPLGNRSLPGEEMSPEYYLFNARIISILMLGGLIGLILKISSLFQ